MGSIFKLSLLFLASYWFAASFLVTVIAQETPTVNISPEDLRNDNIDRILELCKPATVRIVKSDSAGSGVIVARQGNVYSVLTNWHVVSAQNPLILTEDDRQHQLTDIPQQLGDADLAILKFYSDRDYLVAPIENAIPPIGETVYAAGFPLETTELENTLTLGNEAFRLVQGKISIVPPKSLPQGYRLGYSNETQVGMSGSPLFNARGELIGIHGRGKNRDPGFGVYIFEDGSEPTPEQLEQMIQSSWGIPIGVYQSHDDR